ncbi:unnamed protein product [Chondrus crispus]|uniref:Uncharacterized protein n=1 Tax=Chondrus crispus TaxID=2769 RepID=R7Q4E9_CHOCR|nr:unnamed protein product [Chondrus crispus]CDF33397.1 unnamed protein product [Chondrus crispus]|eukprot:XP_005713200.1 unnamed protein product [Chondrus crispus]
MHDLQPDSLAPTEPTTTHLAQLILASFSHPDDIRIVYEFLPLLMLRVFGYRQGHGWLETASELPSKDRDALIRFTMPGGPIDTYCRRNSPPRDAAVNFDVDMRFEFPVSSLPLATRDALREGPSAALVRPITDGQSFLAPFLFSSLKDTDEKNVYLSPIDYFYICMVASPTRKWAPSSGQNPARRVRRSASLPSTRALYNRTIASYASALNGTDRVGPNSLFLATCLDFLFMPWASYRPSSEPPVASTNAAESVTSILLALAPAAPSALDLDLDFHPMDVPDELDWRIQTNTSAVYRAAEKMLENVLKHYEPEASLGPLVAYMRILALYIAPWRASIRNGLSACLFPKKKTSSSRSNHRTPSMAAITSTLSSINAHLASPSGSPGNASSVKESQWRTELKERQRSVDDELLRLAIVKAAHRRFPAFPEGSRVLAVLAEAAQAARLAGTWSSRERDMDKAEELKNCLLALRNQIAESERSSARRERSYIGTLAASVGIRLESGVLGGISEMVGVGGSSGVAGVVNMLSGSPHGKNLKELRQRRLSVFRTSDEESVPFLGNVWDRPIAEGENEVVVVWLYWLALRLEPRLGYVPNLRFLGRYWILLLLSIVVCCSYFVRGLMTLSLG